MKRYTKIIATLGPASSDEDMILKLAIRGMNVARINFSHGTEDQHKNFVKRVRKINKEYRYDVKLLGDLAGYRIRVGHLKKKYLLVKDKVYYMSSLKDDTADHIPFDFDGDISDIKDGSQVFIDDGRLQLKVVEHVGKKLKLKIIQGGILESRKGINIPALKVQPNNMTDQDRKDLGFAIKHKFDYIAQSFVRNKRDIERVVDIVKPKVSYCKVIAKIENQDGVNNIDSIIEACDGVMVARGDLGVTLPLFKIPIVQKYIIHHCNRLKKLSITATQMLDSMVTAGRPTRAEVSDIANAILDGTDFVMLSGETSVGKYPSRSTKIMSQIIEYTERSQDMRI